MKRGIIKLLFFVTLALAGFTVIVMLLWNAVITSIFALGAINFWQAAGLLLLLRILFGGIGRKPNWGMQGGGFGEHVHGRFHEDHRKNLREKWMKMSPKEKSEFMIRKKRAWHLMGMTEEELNAFISKLDTDNADNVDDSSSENSDGKE
ncbi:MAG: hypothetical protein LBT27_03160 [Prevotellaceae bacterium]|jgi:hypothetical protein|nr:hypothetical protein [Prevotellaceae bacterium]